MNELIIIVDDEPDILQLVSVNLKKDNFRVKEFSEPAPFIKFLGTQKPDLLVLDLMLPEMSGFEIMKHLKKNDTLAKIPVIMLTARSDESDKLLGLELGADDYVTKPFSPKELVARIKAVLRRSASRNEGGDIIAVGDEVVLDLKKYTVMVKNEKADLTPTEFKILKLLAGEPGHVFTREQILDYLWGSEKAVIDRTIDVHIKHLRGKLGDAGEYIKNIRGVGYKIEL